MCNYVLRDEACSTFTSFSAEKVIDAYNYRALFLFQTVFPCRKCLKSYLWPNLLIRLNNVSSSWDKNPIQAGEAYVICEIIFVSKIMVIAAYWIVAPLKFIFFLLNQTHNALVLARRPQAHDLQRRIIVREISFQFLFLSMNEHDMIEHQT